MNKQMLFTILPMFGMGGPQPRQDPPLSRSEKERRRVEGERLMAAAREKRSRRNAERVAPASKENPK